MTIEKKAQKVIKQLNKNFNKCKIPSYKITESSKHNKERTYTISSLKAEIEDGEIYFWDSEDVIMGNRYGLIGFLLKSVKDIIFEGNKIDIIFETNSILIELID